MSWIEALVLGVLQGLTEFIPVSSSGHLEIGSALLGIQSKENLLFSVIVHLGTVFATVVVFREDLKVIFTDLFAFKLNDSTKFVCLILISMIPIFIVGVFFKDKIELLFTGNLLLTGFALVASAGLLLIAHFHSGGNKSVGWTSSFLLGVVQAIAIVPGISRSGATISTALILKIERSKAARFSFLMVLPPILGANALQLGEYMSTSSAHTIGSLPLLVGFLAAFLSGLFACKWMIAMITHGRLMYFSVYCFLLGSVTIISTFI